MVKVGVLLHGCGAKDGSEIHEAVATLIGLQQVGAQVQCIAPDGDQARVIDHRSGEPLKERRSMLVEAARIARGQIKPLSAVKAADFDALIIPGGNGTAANLCDFAEKGAAMTVMPEVAQLLANLHEQRKPIGAICIAPVIIAKVFGAKGVQVTIGNDEAVAKQITAMGAKHMVCAVTDCVVDEDNLLVTTPAYMTANNICEVYEGITKLCREVVSLAAKSKVAFLADSL